MSKLQALQEKRQQLAKQIKAHADACDQKEGGWTAEDSQNWERLNADYDTNLKDLTTEQERVKAEDEAREVRSSRLAEMEQFKDYQPRKPRFGRDDGSIKDGPQHSELFGGKKSQDELKALALQAWFRAPHDPEEVGEVTDEHVEAARACGIGLRNNTLRIKLPKDFKAVKNALSGQTDTAGGFLKDDSFIRNLEKAMLAFGGIMRVASVMRTADGNPVRWPTANDTNNTGRMIGESQAVTTLDPTFAQKVWYAYKFTSDEILVPFELLRDSAFNLADELSMMLGERLGRIQNTKYTVGTGAGLAPTGIVTAATAGVTTASSTAIAWDEVISLEHSLDPSRRNLPGVGFMFHDEILEAFRKLKDGEGRYLWTDGANAMAPDTIHGKPYTINQDMASSIASGNITMLFGQFPQFKVRQVGAVRLYRLVERYRENDQDAFLAFIEGDSNLLDAGDGVIRKMTQV